MKMTTAEIGTTLEQILQQLDGISARVNAIKENMGIADDQEQPVKLEQAEAVDTPWLTLKEAADYIKVSESKMRTDLRHILPFRHVTEKGRLLVIHRKDLDVYLASQEAGSDPALETAADCEMAVDQARKRKVI